MVVRRPTKNPYEELSRGVQSKDVGTKIYALKVTEKLAVWLAEEFQMDVILLPCLNDYSPRVQQHALAALAAMGRKGAHHLEGILRKFTSYDREVRIAAIRAVGRLGPYWTEEAKDKVLQCLHEKDLDVLSAACYAVGCAKVTSAVSKLTVLLYCGDPEVVETACWSLANMDTEAEEVARLLSSKLPRLRETAISSLAVMSHQEVHVQRVVVLLADDDVKVRMAASAFFGPLGVQAKAHVPAIGKLLAHKHPGIVAAAASALTGIGAAAASQIKALESLLGDTREDTSLRSLEVAGMAPKAPSTLRKPACAAIAALAAIGAPSARRVAYRLSSDDVEVREQVLQALGSMGRDGADHVKVILEALNDPSPTVVVAACKTLGSFAASGIGMALWAEAVAARLTSKNPTVRAGACQGLAEFEEAEAFTETFLKLFNDRSPCVKAAAIRALAKCGELGQMYATRICRMMFEGHPAVRIAAIESMLCMGQRGVCFMDEIESLLFDPEVGETAQKVLEQLRERAVPLYVDIYDPGYVDLGYDKGPRGPVLPAALLFPGQGSQYVKMMTEVKDLPGVRAMTEKAKSILGYDILEICLTGPEGRLEQTKVCQPAMYIAGLAALEELKRINPEVVFNKKAVAGLSLGEYTALAAAGVFDFETGLKLVKLRGEAMQEAAEASPQAMCSIAGLNRDTLDRLCEESKTSSSDICKVANFLFPLGFSCAGSKAAVENLQAKAVKEPGCLQAKVLKTTGAFHTEFMKPAKKKLRRALMQLEPRMKSPTCDVYMNVSGKRIGPSTSPSEIVDMLSWQLTSCVEWDTTMKAMIADGMVSFYECGPMKQLKAMMKRINTEAWEHTTSMMV